jgi:hypothetical protein
MVLVAALALMFALVHWAAWHADCRRYVELHRTLAEFSRAKGDNQQAAYHHRLRMKYERAAREPWRSVFSEPSPPK